MGRVKGQARGRARGRRQEGAGVGVLGWTTGATRPGREVRRVNVDFPVWMIASLDAEAARLGITRQAVIKMWIGERLDRGTG